MALLVIHSDSLETFGAYRPRMLCANQVSDDTYQIISRQDEVDQVYFMSLQQTNPSPRSIVMMDPPGITQNIDILL